jgi:VWFA-related protein
MAAAARLLPALLIGTSAVLAAQDQRPTIRSGVELVLVDVQVVDREGYPIETLEAEHFEVSIDGRRRRVVSAELITYASAGTDAGTATGAEGARTGIEQGRRFILAIDEHSFRPLTARAAMHAARMFIERLQPSDLVGLYAYPTGTAHTDLTSDHASVIRELDKVTGLLELPSMSYSLSKSEVIDIASRDNEATRRVVARECGRPDPHCARTIQLESQAAAMQFEMQVSQSLAGLRHLFNGLKDLEGRKTLVIVSGGLFTSDRADGRAMMTTDIRWLGREAARSNTSIYVLHIDWSFIETFSAGRRGAVETFARDASQTAAGLEHFADAGGGAYLRIETGAGERGFDRVIRENSAYYLLGVVPEPADRDGEAHRIQVRVRGQRGATVRSRATVVIPAETRN